MPVLIAMALPAPAAASTTVYSTPTLSKTLTRPWTYDDSNIEACVRYSVTAKVVVPGNRGIGSTSHDVFTSTPRIENPRINSSYTVDCSKWTYVQLEDVKATTSAPIWPRATPSTSTTRPSA